MRFAFRLQPVLDHRLQQEETCQKELSAAQRLHGVELARLQDLVARSDACHDAMQRKGSAGVAAAEMVLYCRYGDHLAARIDRQRQIVRSARDRVAQSRRSLLEVTKKRKTLENLKDRQQSLFDRQAAKQEMRQLDEMAVNRHGRRPH
jgi:flagellar FliJ protein